MFYDTFDKLCRERGVSKSKAASEMGLSNATPTKWKKTGATPDSSTLSKVSVYFGVTVNYLLGLEDERGLTPDDWKSMGTAFHNERKKHGKKLSDAIDNAVISEDDLALFEQHGNPINDAQLMTICGLIGADPTALFLPWAGRLWPDKASIPSNSHSTPRIEDEFTFAAHQYSGKLLDRDKEMIIKLMQTMAEANNRGEKNGETN